MADTANTKAGLTFMYATGGSDFWMLARVVDSASRVLTPRVTRAGA